MATTEEAIARIVKDAHGRASEGTDTPMLMFDLIRIVAMLVEEVSCAADELRGIKQAIIDHQEGK